MHYAPLFQFRIAAGKIRMGKTIYLRCYGNISGSISYFKVLANARAYPAYLIDACD
jgi:hypothetical protein